MALSKITIADKPNKQWATGPAQGVITIKRRPLLKADDKFFAIGSCFAEEIRKALKGRNVECLPRYAEITWPKNTACVDTLPYREHMNFYSTWTILQEFQRAAGTFKQDDNDMWPIHGFNIDSQLQPPLVRDPEGKITLFQDPYRRKLFSKSPEGLISLRRQIDRIFKQGLEEATAVIITLGMTEVYIRPDGSACGEAPVYAGTSVLRETKPHLSTFAENMANLTGIRDTLRQINPTARIFLSVSPVPMSKSFGPNDIWVNNYASKCTLRATAEEFARAYPDDVTYFPSFEFIWGIGSAAYEDDQIHIKPSVVSKVVAVFQGAYFAES
jgi:hypothetical protein